jgi:hypothetical protein
MSLGNIVIQHSQKTKQNASLKMVGAVRVDCQSVLEEVTFGKV